MGTSLGPCRYNHVFGILIKFKASISIFSVLRVNCTWCFQSKGCEALVESFGMGSILLERGTRAIRGYPRKLREVLRVKEFNDPLPSLLTV